MKSGTLLEVSCAVSAESQKTTPNCVFATATNIHVNNKAALKKEKEIKISSDKTVAPTY